MHQISLNILKYVLKQLARLTIWRFEPDIIAITGSVGKTSAKEAIFAVLSGYSNANGKKNVRKASENFNNELGVPLTILGSWQKVERPLIFFWLKIIVISALKLLFSFISRFNYPDILILEYGASKPGDIKYLLEIAQPKIAVVTAVGEVPVHIEFYSDVEAIAREKAKLIDDLSSLNWAVLNNDDNLVLAMKEKTRAQILTFGFSSDSNLKITSFENRSENNKPIGISFKFEKESSFVPVNLRGVFGKAHAYAAAIGALVGVIYGINLVEAAEALSANYKPAKARMNLIYGIKNSYIIDDSYNASPLSMESALETLKELEGERKIAILGDMLELGKYSIEAHESIGKLAAQSADILITVGPRGKFMADSAIISGLEKNKVLFFDTAEEALNSIKKLLKKDDIILIKASHAVGLDKIVEEIKIAG
ncbi:MAG: UDP-N-acetylmuramoyl-tripeptide--D-alanyl-D-alanine ligase [Patescibacteria group bacterium]